MLHLERAEPYIARAVRRASGEGDLPAFFYQLVSDEAAVVDHGVEPADEFVAVGGVGEFLEQAQALTGTGENRFGPTPPIVTSLDTRSGFDGQVDGDDATHRVADHRGGGLDVEGVHEAGDRAAGGEHGDAVPRGGDAEAGELQDVAVVGLGRRSRDCRGSCASRSRRAGAVQEQ